MSNVKALITSRGVYVVQDGQTVECSENSEVTLDSEQANKLVARGKATLINNTKPAETKPKSKKK